MRLKNILSPPKGPPLPEKSGVCPYLNEANLTTSDKGYKKIVIGDEIREWRNRQHALFITLDAYI